MESVNFKIGDKVYIRTKWTERIETIERETKTRFYTKNYTFNKKDNVIVGDKLHTVEKATQEHFDRLRKNMLERTLNNFDFSTLSIDVLEKVYELIKSHKEN